MDAKPLPKEIYEKALRFGVREINLHFSGGDDQGYLNVTFVTGAVAEPIESLEKNFEDFENFEGEIEDWAFQAYHYSGAGDGTEYGHDITYDLVNKRVTISEWESVRQYGENMEEKMEVF